MFYEPVTYTDYYDYAWTRMQCDVIVVPAHNCAMLPAAPCDVPGACSSGVSISAPSIIGTICSGSAVSVQFNASGIAAGNMYAVQWSSGSYFTYTGHQYAENGNITLVNVSVPIGYATMSIAIFASNPTTLGPSSSVTIFAGLLHLLVCSR